MIERSKQFIIEDSEDSGEESHEAEKKPKEPTDESTDILPVIFTFIFGLIIGVSLIIIYQRYTSEPILTLPSEISIDVANERVEIPIKNEDQDKEITGIKIEGRVDGSWMLIDENPQLPPNETWTAKVELTKKTTVVDIASYIFVVCYSEGYTAYTDEYPFILGHKNFTGIKNITCYNTLRSEVTEENISVDIPNSDLLFRITCDNCRERSRTITVENVVEEVLGFVNKTECNLELCNVNSCLRSNCRAKVDFYRIGGYNFLDFENFNV